MSTADLEHAVTTRIQEDSNQAFEQHWKDTDTSTHHLLSALAWATTPRPQLDIRGIEVAMRETRIELERNHVFVILEKLVEEEILERDGTTYRFTAPLYRRWVAWRWPPERVREEGRTEILKSQTNR